MSGILNDKALQEILDKKQIEIKAGYKAQIQPASLDVQLSSKAYRIRASFLPRSGESVADKLKAHALHEFSLDNGAVLETGCVYIVPLLEAVHLPPTLAAMANPKSSTGRLDVFTRVIADGVSVFDTIPKGYNGPLYLEIAPRTFPIKVRTGTRLAQIRLFESRDILSDSAHKTLHEQAPLVNTSPSFNNGLILSVDLSVQQEGWPASPIGYRAKRHTTVIDCDEIARYPIEEFWEPIFAPKGHKHLILDPNEFYILASKEAVHIPPDFAAEMIPVDPNMGEFRVHYAGFFDPGFGHDGAGGKGSRGVLEVRSRDVPFMIEDGQPVCRLVYERMQAAPQALYGAPLGSNYQGQGLKLSKHFK